MPEEKLSNAWLDVLAKLYESKFNLKSKYLSGNKREKIKNYLKGLEDARQQLIKEKDSSLEELFKKFYYDLYVINEEDIPYSVYEAEVKAARELGYGDIPITDEYKRSKNKQIIDDQKKSLDEWIEYFLYDEEAKFYKPWEVFWVLEGIQKLGIYDKEKAAYTKRNKNTIYPFPEVNKQAVFNTLNLMEEFLKSKKAPSEIKSAVSQANFKQIYEYSIRQLELNNSANNTTEGIWVKYNQNSDYRIMRDSLKNYHTGWCIAAGSSFACDYLKRGDFYIYYTKDENGEYKIPRIAIRMEGTREIGEIRGILNDQNMEPEMLPILEEKLKEFPNAEFYLKKKRDMEKLTEIEKKVKSGIKLNREEILFLFQIGYKINGFGWSEDPRIKELVSAVAVGSDIKLAFSEKEIANDITAITSDTIFINMNGIFVCANAIDKTILDFIIEVCDTNSVLTSSSFKCLYLNPPARNELITVYDYALNNRNIKKDFADYYGCRQEDVAFSLKDLREDSKVLYLTDQLITIDKKHIKKVYSIINKRPDQYLTDEEVILLYKYGSSDIQKALKIVLKEAKEKRNARFDIAHYLRCKEEQVVFSDNDINFDTLGLYMNADLIDISLSDSKYIKNIYEKITNSEDLTSEEIRLIKSTKHSNPIVSANAKTCFDLYVKKGGLLAEKYGCTLSEVANSPMDFKRGGIKIYNGDLICGDEVLPDEYKELIYVNGNLDLSYIKVCDGLSHLNTVNGNLYLYNLEDIGKLNQAVNIKGNLYMSAKILSDKVYKIREKTIFAAWILKYNGCSPEENGVLAIIKSTYTGNEKYADKKLSEDSLPEMTTLSYLDADLDMYSEMVDKLIEFYKENEYWPIAGYYYDDDTAELSEFYKKVLMREISLPTELEERLIEIDDEFFASYTY